MSKENPSELIKLDKWQEKYSALVIALLCLFILIISWGEHWILTGVFGLGVLILGTIGAFDIKRINNEKK